MEKEKILQRLKEFSEFPEDWHYKEGQKIELEAIAKTITLLDIIGYEGKSIYPLLDGGIQVEFNADNDEIEIEIYKDRVEFFVEENSKKRGLKESGHWTQEELDRAKEKAPEYLKVWGIDKDENK